MIRKISFMFLLVLFWVGGPFCWGESTTAVVVMTQTGKGAWKRQVRKTLRASEITNSSDIFWGSGKTQQDQEALGRLILRLKTKGAKNILALPFLVSSFSPQFRHYEFMLGLRETSGWAKPFSGQADPLAKGRNPVLSPSDVVFDVPIFLLKALDDGPEMYEALRDRSGSVSQGPPGESVMILGLFSGEKEDVKQWTAALEPLGRQLKEEMGFSDVWVKTDFPEEGFLAPSFIVDMERVLASGTRLLVVPVVLQENVFGKNVKGYFEKWPVVVSDPLGSHPAFSRWFVRKVKKALRAVP